MQLTVKALFAAARKAWSAVLRPFRCLLGFLSPIIFLSMPTQRLAGYEEETDEAGGAAPAPPPSPTFTVPGTPPPEPEQAAPAETGGLKLAHSAPASSGAALPPPQIFQRGAFMFNRRFFETKIPGILRRRPAQCREGHGPAHQSPRAANASPNAFLAFPPTTSTSRSAKARLPRKSSFPSPKSTKFNSNTKTAPSSPFVPNLKIHY